MADSSTDVTALSLGNRLYRVKRIRTLWVHTCAYPDLLPSYDDVRTMRVV